MDGVGAYVALADPLMDLYEQPLELPGREEEIVLDGGLADPSADLPPLPPPLGPPELQPPAPARKRPRASPLGLTVTVELPHGIIKYYPSNGNFEATCDCHKAARCTLTKSAVNDTAAASSSSDVPTWRPLGLLAAFLESGPLRSTKADHKDKPWLRQLAGPESRRFRYEARLRLAEIPAAALLFSEESFTLGIGIEEEPETV